MRMHVLISSVLLAAPVIGVEPLPGYRPLAFLAGHCWKGTFPDGVQTDEHCFNWIYGGKFLRDVHVVRAPGRADYRGETIYFWDPDAQRVEYLYIEDQGGFSRGVMATDAEGLVFPPTSFVEGEKTVQYRSRWQPAGSSAYQVLTEFKNGEEWVPGFEVRMERVKNR